MSTPKKNPALACVLSLLWPGIGQIYNGQTGKGIGFIIIAIIAVMTVLFISLPFFIYAAYDSYATAKKINTGELQTY
jgi:TM2 domain-containing membrane protein YozV